MVELSEHADGALTRSFGGDTLNTALYMARLGAAVDYVTALGDDPFSADMLAAWEAEGVGTALVARMPGRLPGLYLIRTTAAGERSFHYWRDSAPSRQLPSLPAFDAFEPAIRAASLIYVSGVTLSLFDGPGRVRLFAVLAAARAAGARIAFDTNFRPRGWPDAALARAAFDQAFAGADIVLASVEDMDLLHGPTAPDRVLARLRAAGVAEAVVKLATPACLVAAPGPPVFIEAAPVADVIDTTAAGDSFAAAYLVSRLRGIEPLAAARAGHTLAGAVIRHRGAIIPRPAMPPGAAL